MSTLQEHTSTGTGTAVTLVEKACDPQGAVTLRGDMSTLQEHTSTGIGTAVTLEEKARDPQGAVTLGGDMSTLQEHTSTGVGTAVTLVEKARGLTRCSDTRRRHVYTPGTHKHRGRDRSDTGIEQACDPQGAVTLGRDMSTLQEHTSTGVGTAVTLVEKARGLTRCSDTQRRHVYTPGTHQHRGRDRSDTGREGAWPHLVQ
ncbi:hypothetical protein NDU88_000187 [Pleurodeles waltl]|uniref:Uncharacterized protein n=1 Tax=Pleurodeles waltl TaxID=8319 RepID=A0AAV7L7L4_PLEWA|nr:hypothetical protein NDU88_000187 [Pleurodeles waltl]